LEIINENLVVSETENPLSLEFSKQSRRAFRHESISLSDSSFSLRLVATLMPTHFHLKFPVFDNLTVFL
jgi:hypothetical protein